MGDPSTFQEAAGNGVVVLFGVRGGFSRRTKPSSLTLVAVLGRRRNQKMGFGECRRKIERTSRAKKGEDARRCCRTFQWNVGSGVAAVGEPLETRHNVGKPPLLDFVFRADLVFCSRSGFWADVLLGRERDIQGNERRFIGTGAHLEEEAGKPSHQVRFKSKDRLSGLFGFASAETSRR